MGDLSSSAHWGPPPAAPPTVPGPLGPGPRKAWPTVLGVISIVFGALGIVGASFGLLFLVMLPVIEGWMQGAGAPPQATAQWGAMRSHLGLMVADGVVKIVLSILLLIAGIFLVRRRPAGVTLSWWWSIARLASGVLSAVAAYQMQQAQFQGMSAAGGPGLPAGFTTTLSLGGVLFGLLWAWAYPVFLMIWFCRPAVRDEVATWEPAP